MSNLPDLVFSLRLPPSWAEIPLHPATRDAAIAHAVRDRARERPELESRRPAIVRYLRDLARQSWETGCRYLGVFVEPASDGILTGSLTVTVLPALAGDDPLESIGERLRDAERAGGEDEWLNTQIVEVGAQRAVRRYGIQHIRVAPAAQPMRVVLMQTFVPIHGGVALITGSSPSADIADSLFELFDSVTQTFRVMPGVSR